MKITREGGKSGTRESTRVGHDGSGEARAGGRQGGDETLGWLSWRPRAGRASSITPSDQQTCVGRHVFSLWCCTGFWSTALITWYGIRFGPRGKIFRLRSDEIPSLPNRFIERNVYPISLCRSARAVF